MAEIKDYVCSAGVRHIEDPNRGIELRIGYTLPMRITAYLRLQTPERFAQQLGSETCVVVIPHELGLN